MHSAGDNATILGEPIQIAPAVQFGTVDDRTQ